MSHKGVRTILILILFLVVCAAATWYVVQTPVREEAATDAAVTLIDSEETPYVELDGQPFSFSELRGQVRVVTVWASWVPQMAEELTVLDAIAEQYQDTDVVILAVNRKEPKKRIEAFLKQVPELQHVRMVVDETDAFYQAAGGYAMPETRVYDTSGTIVFEVRGPLAESDLVSQVDALVP